MADDRQVPAGVSTVPHMAGEEKLGNPVEGERDSGLKLNTIPL